MFHHFSYLFWIRVSVFQIELRDKYLSSSCTVSSASKCCKNCFVTAVCVSPRLFSNHFLFHCFNCILLCFKRTIRTVLEFDFFFFSLQILRRRYGGADADLRIPELSMCVRCCWFVASVAHAWRGRFYRLKLFQIKLERASLSVPVLWTAALSPRTRRSFECLTAAASTSRISKNNNKTASLRASTVTSRTNLCSLVFFLY